MDNKCNTCGEDVEGLMFYCVACDLFMHYSCAKYQFCEIKHNCHADHHFLHLGKGFFGDKYPQCNACVQACKDTLFSCLKCGEVGAPVSSLEFATDLECILLPSVVKHKGHLHPLILTTLVIEDDYEEYYCDTCETKRNQEHDIYYCNECNYISHIDCMLSEVEPPEKILQYLTPHPRENGKRMAIYEK
ncbi:DC1 domain-containing protein [Gossypium australe]|uniref:DC1 domain-containing protein n=1 Tax=Gossypium australe TaxID=47621 RepID=A0A5B6VUB7_9ROSI|nr:DC1 domain-containing protein [Gossypium australe]